MGEKKKERYTAIPRRSKIEENLIWETRYRVLKLSVYLYTMGTLTLIIKVIVQIKETYMAFSKSLIPKKY